MPHIINCGFDPSLPLAFKLARLFKSPIETIFTDEPVRPGETYLMYPLSNPLRVDPILVPAGDVVWKD